MSIGYSRAKNQATSRCNCRRNTSWLLISRLRKHLVYTVPPALLARADEVIE